MQSPRRETSYLSGRDNFRFKKARRHDIIELRSDIYRSEYYTRTRNDNTTESCRFWPQSREKVRKPRSPSDEARARAKYMRCKAIYREVRRRDASRTEMND